jgi:hypothetical protein
MTTTEGSVDDPQLDQISATAKGAVCPHCFEGVLLVNLAPNSSNIAWTTVISVTGHHLGTKSEDQHVAGTIESSFGGLSKGRW